MRAFILSLIFCLVAGCSLPCFAISSTTESQRIVNFNIFYPLILFKGPSFKTRQKNYAGVNLSYEIYFDQHFGLTFGPTAWFIPVRVTNNDVQNSKQTLYNLSLNLGAVARPLPKNWFDPTISIYSGVGGSDAGSAVASRFNFPVGSRLSLNLYRQTDPFQDSSLAFAVVGDSIYYVRQLPGLKPWFFDVGIALRGSF